MNANYKDLYIQAGTVFSPGAPVNKKDLFAGRINELARAVEAINTRGHHAIIFGERGVGKTSIANILKEQLESVGIKNIIVNKTNCSSSDNFRAIWQRSLGQVAYLAEEPTVGFESPSRQIDIPLSAGMPKRIGPDEIVNAFRNARIPIVFIFDEFDRITDNATQNLFADTMKSLTDNLLDATLILVGVGESIEQLIKSHESIERSLIQIMIPRMDEEELNEIMNAALSTLGMKIDKESSELVLRLSQGLPHYTHLIGLASVRQALLTGSLHVMLGNVHSGIENAVKDAQHSIIKAYQDATTSPYKGHLYKEVLLACALTQGDEFGRFAAGDVRDPLREITGKRKEIPAFAQHLKKFCSEERGRILIKTGRKKNFRYYFRNPLLKPFVVIRGFVDGLLREGTINLIPSWKP